MLLFKWISSMGINLENNIDTNTMRPQRIQSTTSKVKMLLVSLHHITLGEERRRRRFGILQGIVNILVYKCYMYLILNMYKFKLFKFLLSSLKWYCWCPVRLPFLEAKVAGACQSNQWLLLAAGQEDCQLNK